MRLVAVADADEEQVATPLPVSVPLLSPALGVPAVIDTEEAFDAALAELAGGSGSYAFDAERASGYKYSARAYLIQIKRDGGGLHLLDPIPFSPNHRCFLALNELIKDQEVILHASTQDLPCLRELGINPQILLIPNSVAVLQALPVLDLDHFLKL